MSATSKIWALTILNLSLAHAIAADRPNVEGMRLATELVPAGQITIASPIMPATTNEGSMLSLPPEIHPSAEYSQRAYQGKSTALIGGQETAPAEVLVNQKSIGIDRSSILVKLNNGSRVLSVGGVGDDKRTLRKTPSGSSAITLPLAVTASQSYSNEIAGAEAKSAAASHFTSAAVGAFLPRVEYFNKAGSEESAPSAITDASGQKVLKDKHKYRDTTLQASQPLIDVPAIYEYKRQKSIEGASQEALASAKERVSQEVAVSFLRLIESRLAQVISDEYEASLKKLLDWTTQRSAAGATSATDTDRVRARVIAAKASMIDTTAQLEAARIQFRRLTGFEPASIELPERLLSELPADVESALELAFSGNSDLKAALSEVDAIKFEQKGKLGKLLPKFEFQYSDNRIYNAGGIAANPPEQNTFPTQRDKRALFVLSFNLFNGGSDVNQARALAEKSSEARYHAAEIKRRLEERVLINFETLVTVRERIAAIREEIEVNEKVAAAFNEQLVLANRPLLDILDALQRVNDSKLQLVRMVVSEATASYQLLANVGAIRQAFSSQD